VMRMKTRPNQSKRERERERERERDDGVRIEKCVCSRTEVEDSAFVFNGFAFDSNGIEIGRLSVSAVCRPLFDLLLPSPLLGAEQKTEGKIWKQKG
jgi:hypothetical protein